MPRWYSSNGKRNWLARRPIERMPGARATNISMLRKVRKKSAFWRAGIYDWL
jgi:hypothetical protein